MSNVNPRLKDPEGVLKCACGDILRRKNWADHWYICYKGSARPATAEEIKSLLCYEEHRRQQDAEHEQWRITELPKLTELFRERARQNGHA
jgi:hypothetical protein